MSNLTAKEADALKHWSLFGRKSEPSAQRATADGWKIIPMLTPVTSAWTQSVPQNQIPKLLNGFVPMQMEDKWFVYADGPDEHGNVVLHMVRSWTEHKMVEAKLVVDLNEDGEITGKDAEFVQIIWESDEERFRQQTEEGAKSMAKQVCKWCMDVDLP
jgi:hypothetical protein